VPITSKWLHNNFKYIYDKYKTELDLLNKYINNEYIYNIHYSRVIFINELCFFLNSNINQYECIFLNNIIKNYIKTHPKKIYNIFEIGCAYGTSGMIISNIFTKIKNTLNFWSIDPNQKFQWHNIGDYNINNIIKQSPYKNINWNLIEQYSHESIQYLQSLNIHFDICFIDGAHDFINVYGDIVLTDSILNINGIIILDDIKHDGVKESVLYFFKHNDRYKRIYFNDNLELQYTKSLYTYNKSTKSFTNPDTMYAFIKLF
jgi:predicted O-methyltransferase YrrM